MPNCGNSNSWLSKAHSEPDGFFSPFSDVNHWASRTFTTNQPSPADARPEPESSSGASGTARVLRMLRACATAALALAGDLRDVLRGLVSGGGLEPVRRGSRLTDAILGR